MNISFILSLVNASDQEIVEMAKHQKINLSLEDVRLLRATLSEAKMDWLVTGIPTYLIKDLSSQLGEKKVRQILKLIQ